MIINILLSIINAANIKLALSTAFNRQLRITTKVDMVGLI